jgi:uncharacterized protein HemX
VPRLLRTNLHQLLKFIAIYPDEQGDSRLIASVDTERIRENIRTEMKFFIEI